MDNHPRLDRVSSGTRPCDDLGTLSNKYVVPVVECAKEVVGGGGTSKAQWKGRSRRVQR